MNVLQDTFVEAGCSEIYDFLLLNLASRARIALPSESAYLVQAQSPSRRMNPRWSARSEVHHG